MGPAEFWWLVEHRQPIKMYGSMTQHQVEQLYDETYDTSGKLKPIHVRFPKLRNHPKWRHR